MSTDLNNSYESVESKIKASRTWLEIKRDRKKLIQEQKDNLAKAKKNVSTSVEKLKDKKKRYQREVKTQLNQMLNIAQFNSGNGSATIRYIKSKFIQAALNIQPKLLEILFKESVNAIGCSQQQTFPDGLTIYIKVKSVDIQNLLKRSPEEENMAAAYEKTAPQPKSFPFSMNRELWSRLQQVNVPVDFIGISGNKLFDIAYVTSIPPSNITGDFFRVRLAGGSPNNFNKVFDFFVEYYRSIQLVDVNNLFLQLMDLITGAFSFQMNIGVGEIEMKNKFALLLQRILGLCFDSKKEIDVTGNSKVAELDGVDESFFEFTDIDLRFIDQVTTNIKNGVMEFEDCENVLLPIDSRAIIDGVLQFNQATSKKEEQDIAESLTSIISEDERWKLLFPNNFDLELNLDLSFLESLPKAIMMSLLSPKVILPIMIMIKAIQQVGVSNFLTNTGVDLVEDFVTFIKTFKKYTTNVMSKIGGLFIQELFEIIKKDIKTLIREIVSDVARETAQKKISIILKLVEILLIVSKFVDDWRRCKSVVDEILALLTILGSSLKLPGFLLAGSELLSGFSSARAGINAIEEFQKLGLPTGPMPDGSPNLMLASLFGSIAATQKEDAENGKVQIFIKPLAQTPVGVTKPNGAIFGKKM
jgi:hypothetical protein